MFNSRVDTTGTMARQSEERPRCNGHPSRGTMKSTKKGASHVLAVGLHDLQSNPVGLIIGWCQLHMKLFPEIAKHASNMIATRQGHSSAPIEKWSQRNRFFQICLGFDLCT